MRSLGPWKLPYYIRVKKQRNIKSWDQQNYLVIRGFCYIRPLYNEVPLYHSPVIGTGETQYNEILGTRNFCLLYTRYLVISIMNKQYKTRKFIHWDRGGMSIMSDILSNQISLYGVSTLLVYYLLVHAFICNMHNCNFYMLLKYMYSAIFIYAYILAIIYLST